MLSRRLLIASIIATTGRCEDDCGRLCRTDPNCLKGSFSKSGSCHSLFFLPDTGKSQFCVHVLATQATCLSSFQSVSLADATSLLAGTPNLTVVTKIRPAIRGMDRDEYFEWKDLERDNGMTKDEYYEWSDQRTMEHLRRTFVVSGGYSVDSPQIEWFFGLLASFDAVRRYKFLQHNTDGMMRLEIRLADTFAFTRTTKLAVRGPTGWYVNYKLDLPRYPTKKILVDRVTSACNYL